MMVWFLLCLILSIRLTSFAFQRKLVPSSRVRETNTAREYRYLVSTCVTENPTLFRIISGLTVASNVVIAILQWMLLSTVMHGILLILVWYFAAGLTMWLVNGMSVAINSAANGAFSIIAVTWFWPVWIAGAISVFLGLTRVGSKLKTSESTVN